SFAARGGIYLDFAGSAGQRRLGAAVVEGLKGESVHRRLDNKTAAGRPNILSPTPDGFRLLCSEDHPVSSSPMGVPHACRSRSLPWLSFHPGTELERLGS